jgi:hypothetical protein
MWQFPMRSSRYGIVMGGTPLTRLLSLGLLCLRVFPMSLSSSANVSLYSLGTRDQVFPLIKFMCVLSILFLIRHSDKNVHFSAPTLPNRIMVLEMNKVIRAWETFACTYANQTNKTSQRVGKRIERERSAVRADGTRTRGRGKRGSEY